MKIISLTRTSLLSPIILIILLGCSLEEIPPDNELRAAFTFAVTNDCNGACTVQFTNNSSNAETYQWSFGDATSATSTDENPTFSYGTSGDYSVKLRAIRGEESVEQTSVVSVTVLNPTGGNGKMFQHIATTSNTAGHETEIDDELVNGNENLVLIVSTVLGDNFARNTSPLAVQYVGNRWRIRNLNTLESIASGVEFNILVRPITDTHAYIHTATSSTLRTSFISTMDHPMLNNKPNARVFVTPRRDGSNSVPATAVGVLYVNNRWEIINLDTSRPIPFDTRYNVFIDEDDQSSFVHNASLASVYGDLTTCDYSTTNARADLKLIVTPNQGNSASPILNPRVPGLWFDTESDKWTVFNQDGEVMPFDARYNIFATE